MSLEEVRFFSKRAMLTHAHTKETCHLEERVSEQMEIKFKGYSNAFIYTCQTSNNPTLNLIVR